MKGENILLNVGLFHLFFDDIQKQPKINGRRGAWWLTMPQNRPTAYKSSNHFVFPKQDDCNHWYGHAYGKCEWDDCHIEVCKWCGKISRHQPRKWEK